MLNATYPPRRMRFSFESRCRIVQLILAGRSPQAAAAACGASRATGYRLWRRHRDGGWAALACAAFLRRATAWYGERGITIERVLTDNAKAYHSHLWHDTCAPSSASPAATRAPTHPGRTARPRR